jgi:predicted lipoprotein with Yx(FWY)xxD motif
MRAAVVLSVLVLAGCASVDMPKEAGSQEVNHVPMATPLGVTVQAVGKAFYNADAPSFLSFSMQSAYAFADAQGMTLYTYDRDREEPGQSVCDGECATYWPPLVAPADAVAEGDWSLITRDDGRGQWAFRGMPLYRFAEDTLVGHDLGRGLDEERWKVAVFEPVAEIVLPASMHIEEVPDALGQALFNERGRVLYTYTGDLHREQPRCGALPCRWEPVAAPQLAAPLGDFTIVTRMDQTRQWSYTGQPLFSYSGDFESGYAAGMGIDEKMNVAVLVKYFIPPDVTLQSTVSQGKVLADANGMTLYRRDSWAFQQGGHGIRRGVPPRPVVGRGIGTSMQGCDNACQKVWTPFEASEDAQASGYWQITSREDGTRQWVYKGYALYTYAGDHKPGDLLGTDYYDFILSLDPHTQTAYPAPTHGMGALAWLYAFP